MCALIFRLHDVGKAPDQESKKKSEKYSKANEDDVVFFHGTFSFYTAFVEDLRVIVNEIVGGDKTTGKIPFEVLSLTSYLSF